MKINVYKKIWVLSGANIMSEGENVVGVSKVLHIHSNHWLNTYNIINYLKRFGEIAYVFNMKSSFQMLVEMKKQNVAKKIIDTHGRSPIEMDNSLVYFQYSRSREINRSTGRNSGMFFIVYLFF
jgi:hypothetical protein